MDSKNDHGLNEYVCGFQKNIHGFKNMSTISKYQCSCVRKKVPLRIQENINEKNSCVKKQAAFTYSKNDHGSKRNVWVD